MLAARLHEFGSIDNLRIEDVQDAVAAAGEAVIRVTAAGLNRADTEFIKGVYGAFPRNDAGLWRDRHFPQIPGIEAVGIVQTAPDGPLKPGDRVLVHSHLSCGHCEFCTGGRDNYCVDMKVLGTQTPGRGAFAEKLAWPAASLLRIPDDMDFGLAATVGVQVATAWWMLRHRARVRQGDVVLVQGASGGIGIAALQIARLLGARPVAVTRDGKKAASLLAAGASEVLVDDGTAPVSRMFRELVPNGADVVVEAVGGPLWNESLDAVRQGGTVVVCGGHAGAVVPLSLGTVFGKQLDIVGSARAPVSCVMEAIDLVAQGRIRIPVDRVFKFRDICSALKRLEDGKHTGKIVIDMQDGEDARATN